MNEYIKTENHNQISEILMMIEDEEKRNNVIIDIFSLIFLKKNGEFVCDVNKAETLLMAISGFLKDSSFITAATGRLLFARIIGSLKLEDSLISTQEAVVKMLKMKEFDVALNMAASYPILKNIVRMSMSENDKSIEPPEIYEIEKFLSTHKLMSSKIDEKSDKFS